MHIACLRSRAGNVATCAQFSTRLSPVLSRSSAPVMLGSREPTHTCLPHIRCIQLGAFYHHQVAEMTEKLKALLVQHGLDTEGRVVLTQYHPKRAPRWMRINEVRPAF